MLVFEWGLISAIRVKLSTVNRRIDDLNMVYIYRKYLSNRIYGSSGVPIQENVCHCIDVNYCNQCEVNLQLTI